MASIVDIDIANNVLDGVIELQGTRRDLDATIEERRCLTVTQADIALYNTIWSYNSGELSDGKNTYFVEDTIYVKIPVNIHMIEQGTKVLEDVDIKTAEEAGMEGQASLQVFIDGYKIPDNQIKFYPTRSNVDVFIPNSYLVNGNNHEVIVEKRFYQLFPYIHYYDKYTSNQTFSIGLSDFTKNKLESISGNYLRCLQIYVNKRLYNGSRSVSLSGKNLLVTVQSEVSNDEIEIEFDPFVVWYFPTTSEGDYSDVKNVWEISEDYLDSIHGPISRFSCAFYKNGLRVMNTDIIQKGRLHFEYDDEESTNNSLSFYLSDRNLIIDKEFTFYGSDYYMYNFIGCDAITKALHTTLSGNSFIDEGAYKEINFSVNRSIGSSKVTVTLPESITFTDDGTQSLRIGVYVTKAVGSGMYNTAKTITWLPKESYEFDSSKNPITITIITPNSYIAAGVETFGKVEIDSWYHWDEVLNHYSTLFSVESAKSILKEYHDEFDNEVKIATLLKDRPYLMRNFLENYGNKNFEINVEYNGVDSYVYVGLPEHYTIESSNNYDISINNKHIPNQKIRTLNKDITSVFEIEGKYFNKGSNNIDIQILNNIDVEYKIYKNPNTDILDNDGIRYILVDYFNHVGDIENNIVILQKVTKESDPSVTYFINDHNTGYKLFTDYEFGPYNEETNEFSIIFNTIPTSQMIVYNKNFAKTISYTKPTIATVTDVVIPLYMGSESDPIPYIPRGKVFVYCGNDKFIEGVDYFVKNPEIEPSVGGSYIVMKRIILPGSQVDIYFSNFKTSMVYNKTGYFNGNNYGLFYLSQLKFPFSNKYLNFYINGCKLSEDDIDILSDKLVRVHSMSTPLYDLVIESTFNVDYSELQPYISIYEPDNFERYLERLFVGVDYSGQILTNEGKDANEIYKSFIDTVDSVNKRVNPKAREATWIPSYNEDESLIGPCSNGDEMDGNDILCSIIVGSTYVVAGKNGKIASAIISDDINMWTGCYSDKANFDGAIWSDGSACNGEDINAVALFHDYLIFGTSSGNLYAYGVSSKSWHNKNTIQFLDISSSWPKDTSINYIVVDSISDKLFILGDNGTVDQLTWNTLSWAGTTYSFSKDPEDSVGVTGIMGNIYSAFVISSSPYSILVAMGERGQVCSCYIDCDTINSWCTPYGSSKSDIVSPGIIPSIYDNGETRNFKDILSYCDYFGYKVFVGEDGVVTYFDNPSFISKDNLNICNIGTHSSGKTTYGAVSYNEKIMILGSESGYVSEYEGESQVWNNAVSGIGISDAGNYMQNCDIYTMVMTSGDTNYIIFAGQNGKVCSYCMNVSEVPYRYDPFKSSFLEWYTTPGNAVIQAVWDVPEDVANRFNMLKESNTDTGDIIIRAGDDDLMLDILMNDDNYPYPWTLEERNRFMAHFIKSLPEGDYSPDEIYELYNSTKAKYMIYEDDLPQLAGGNDLDIDDDIIVDEE